MTYTLKQWRMLRGLSRQKLGEMIGKSEVTIWKWETERLSPRLSEIEALRKALNLTDADDILLLKELKTN